MKKIRKMLTTIVDFFKKVFKKDEKETPKAKKAVKKVEVEVVESPTVDVEENKPTNE